MAAPSVPKSYTVQLPVSKLPDLSSSISFTSADSYFDASTPRYHYDDFVFVNYEMGGKKVHGHIKYMSMDRDETSGDLDFTFGIALDRDVEGGHDGQPKGSDLRYFVCPKRRGILVDYTEIEKKVTSGPKPRVTVGDWVKIERIGRGPLVFVGHIYDDLTKKAKTPFYGVDIQVLKNPDSKKVSMGMHFAKGSKVRLYDEPQMADGSPAPVLARGMVGSASMRAHHSIRHTTSKGASFWTRSTTQTRSVRVKADGSVGVGRGSLSEVGFSRDVLALGSILDDSKVKPMFMSSPNSDLVLLTASTLVCDLVLSPSPPLSMEATASVSALGIVDEDESHYMFDLSSDDVKRKRFAVDYDYDEFEDQIGEGGFGVVYRCKKKVVGRMRKVKKAKLFAVKVIKKVPLYDESIPLAQRTAQIKQIQAEVQLLLTLRSQKRKKMRGSQYIVQIEDVYEELHSLYIVTNYCTGGSLLDFLAKHGDNLAETHAQRIVRETLRALKLLDMLQIAHLDLKPDNLLFVNKKISSPIVLIDFGMAQVIPHMTKATRLDGATPHFTAPEMLEGYYDRKADVWSMGVIMFFIIFGYPPFFDDVNNEDDAIHACISEGFYNETKPGMGAWFPAEMAEVSDSAKDLIGKMLTTDLAKRISVGEALDHSWVTGKVSKKKLPHTMERAFLHFSGNGKFMNIVTQLYIPKLSSEDRGLVRDIFEEMDENGDGEIELHEFSGAMKRLGAKHTDEQLRAIFHSIDIDNSGTVDLHELLTSFAYQKMTASEERMMSHFEDLKGSHRTLTQKELFSRVEEFNADLRKARKKKSKKKRKKKATVPSKRTLSVTTREEQALRDLTAATILKAPMGAAPMGLPKGAAKGLMFAVGMDHSQGVGSASISMSVPMPLKTLHFGADTIREAIDMVHSGESDEDDSDSARDSTAHGLLVDDFVKELHPEFHSTFEDNSPSVSDSEHDFEHYLHTMATSRDTTTVEAKAKYLRTLSPGDAMDVRNASMREHGPWLLQMEAMPEVVSMRTERTQLAELRAVAEEEMAREVSRRASADDEFSRSSFADSADEDFLLSALSASKKSIKLEDTSSTEKKKFGITLASSIFDDELMEVSSSSEESSDDDSSSNVSSTVPEEPCFDFF